MAVSGLHPKHISQLHPEDWWTAPTEYRVPLPLGDLVDWDDRRVAGISAQLPHAGYAALWHADADVATAYYLFLDGTFVVTLKSGQVCVLKLYHGNRRIDLDALRQLIMPADAK